MWKNKIVYRWYNVDGTGVDPSKTSYNDTQPLECHYFASVTYA